MDDLDFYLDTLFGGLAGYVYCPVRQPSTNQWHQRFFKWPKERKLLGDWIRITSNELDVYVAPALFGEKSARKNSVIGAQVCWAEFDGQEKIDLTNLPEPSLVVTTSSETHVHVYWKLEFCAPEIVESINRKLTYYLEADSSGWDVNQVLRPPLTTNWKRNTGVKLSFKGAVGATLPPQTFDFINEPPPLLSIPSVEAIPDPLDVLACYSIPSATRKLLLGGESVLKGFRSTYLMQVGYALAELGMGQDEVLSLLLVVDEKVQKFTQRSDQLVRLAEIASIALNKYSALHATPSYTPSELLSEDFNFFSHWGFYLPAGGNIIVAGAPGVGKTQLSLQAACHIILERELLGYSTQASGNMVFFSLEMPPPGFRWLFEKQWAGYSPEDHAILDKRLRLVVPSETLTFDQIEAVIREFEPTGVFFDSLSSMPIEDMAAPKDAKALVEWDRMIRSVYGCFTWYIHHNRKATGDNKTALKISDLYGSFLYGARWDSILMMGTMADGKTKLIPSKTRYGKEEILTLERNTDHLTFKNADTPKNTVALGKKENELSPSTTPALPAPESNVSPESNGSSGDEGSPGSKLLDFGGH